MAGEIGLQPGKTPNHSTGGQRLKGPWLERRSVAAALQVQA